MYQPIDECDDSGKHKHHTFIAIVSGHCKRQERLLECNGILISIGNDHGYYDRWEVITCGPREPPQPETKPTLWQKVFGTTKAMSKLNPWCQHQGKLSLFKADHTDLSLAIYRMAEGLLQEDLNVVKYVMGSPWSPTFSALSFNVLNPPKSGKDHGVIEIGVGDCDDGCYLDMQIYETRQPPMGCISNNARSRLLFDLIRERKITDDQAIITYYNERYKGLCGPNYRDEVGDGPFITLLHLRYTLGSIGTLEHALGIIAKHIIGEIKRCGDEGRLFTLIEQSYKKTSPPTMLSSLSIRMLLDEVALQGTKYHNVRLAYLGVILTILLSYG